MPRAGSSGWCEWLSSLGAFGEVGGRSLGIESRRILRAATGSNGLDGDVMGVGGEGTDVCLVACEHGPVGLREGDDNGVDG